ncbi:hypothetical protein DFH09DRAFT_1098409 [Mycena vulgaris]|nr:hypothetical protein DFH09DRAFT_1098409 [Mycena vulgaris]
MYHRCVSTGEVGGLGEVPEGHRGGVKSFADAADDCWSSGLLKSLHNIMLKDWVNNSIRESTKKKTMAAMPSITAKFAPNIQVHIVFAHRVPIDHLRPCLLRRKPGDLISVLERENPPSWLRIDARVGDGPKGGYLVGTGLPLRSTGRPHQPHSTSARANSLTQPSVPGVLPSGNCWVVVRDFEACACIGPCPSRAPAGGERIIIDVGPCVHHAWLDAAPESPKFQKGICGAVYDAIKSVSMLGTPYRSLEETARDIVVDWEERGWR